MLSCARTGLLLWFVLCFAQGAHADAKSDALLERLLAHFSRVEFLSAKFTEEKTMALLAAPLRSQGEIYYARPRLLARHTRAPQRTSLILRDGSLSFGDATHAETLALETQPAVRVLVDTFVSVLAGDRVTLSKLADVTAESLPEGAWRISLTPKDAGVLRIVRGMGFQGRDVELRQMEVLDANGDRTVTTFSDVRLGNRVGQDEMARLFRVGG